MEEVVEVEDVPVANVMADNRNEELPDVKETDVIKVISSDGVSYETTVAGARYSETLRNLIKDAGIDNAFPVPNVSEHLAPLIVFMNHYSTNPPSADKHTYGGEDREVLDTTLTDFDKEWVDYDAEWDQDHFDTLANYMIAADYLHIREVLDVIAQAMADKTKDMSQEELIKLFNIQESDLPTPDERAEIEKKYAFLKSD
jgi:S-phase kinase-associated protein 1